MDIRDLDTSDLHELHDRAALLIAREACARAAGGSLHAGHSTAELWRNGEFDATPELRAAKVAALLAMKFEHQVHADGIEAFAAFRETEPAPEAEANNE